MTDPLRALYDDWRDFPLHLWRWKNFSRAELACNGTGALMIDPDSLDKLQAMRDLIGAPLVINSAYRSPYWNRVQGGAPLSQHLKAKAYDIRTKGHDPHKLESAARKVGFTSFGRYHGPRYPVPFLHVDDRAEGKQWGDPWPQTPIATALPPLMIRPAPRILIGAEAEAKRAEVAEAIREAIGPKTALKRKRPAAA